MKASWDGYEVSYVQRPCFGVKIFGWQHAYVFQRSFAQEDRLPTIALNLANRPCAMNRWIFEGYSFKPQNPSCGIIVRGVDPICGGNHKWAYEQDPQYKMAPGGLSYIAASVSVTITTSLRSRMFRVKGSMELATNMRVDCFGNPFAEMVWFIQQP